MQLPGRNWKSGFLNPGSFRDFQEEPVAGHYQQNLIPWCVIALIYVSVASKEFPYAIQELSFYKLTMKSHANYLLYQAIMWSQGSYSSIDDHFILNHHPNIMALQSNASKALIVIPQIAHNRSASIKLWWEMIGWTTYVGVAIPPTGRGEVELPPQEPWGPGKKEHIIIFDMLYILIWKIYSFYILGIKILSIN